MLRELALVIPDDVWLVSTTGTVSPDLQVEGSTGNPLRGQAPGPALELIGCGDGQDSVAEFVAALKDIDGVTRVGLNSSELPASDTSVTGQPDSGGGDSSDCRTRDFIAKFEIVVAFDAVPEALPADAVAPETAPVAAVATAPASRKSRAPTRRPPPSSRRATRPPSRPTGPEGGRDRPGGRRVSQRPQNLLVVLAGVGAIAAIWFLLISPKRAEVSDLDSQITAAQTSVGEAEQLAAAAEQAKGTYGSDYQEVVILGKAVPGDDDVSSLLEQVNAPGRTAPTSSSGR